MISLESFKSDWDWQAAFHESVVGGYKYYDGDELDDHPINNVISVYHAYEGEHDEENWIAVVGWREAETPKPFGNSDEDRLVAADQQEEIGNIEYADKLRQLYAVVDAGCDYTGWD